MIRVRNISFEEACAQYVHRFTLDHVPAWAAQPASTGRYYAPQYRSDREWYELTYFPGEVGHPDYPKRTKWCHSPGQTWPLGNWLTEPYTITQPRRVA